MRLELLPCDYCPVENILLCVINKRFIYLPFLRDSNVAACQPALSYKTILCFILSESDGSHQAHFLTPVWSRLTAIKHDRPAEGRRQF